MVLDIYPSGLRSPWQAGPVALQRVQRWGGADGHEAHHIPPAGGQGRAPSPSGPVRTTRSTAKRAVRTGRTGTRHVSPMHASHPPAGSQGRQGTVTTCSSTPHPHHDQLFLRHAARTAGERGCDRTPRAAGRPRSCCGNARTTLHAVRRAAPTRASSTTSLEQPSRGPLGVGLDVLPDVACLVATLATNTRARDVPIGLSLRPPERDAQRFRQLVGIEQAIRRLRQAAPPQERAFRSRRTAVSARCRLTQAPEAPGAPPSCRASSPVPVGLSPLSPGVRSLPRPSTLPWSRPTPLLHTESDQKATRATTKRQR